jgi:hypothetical protein
VSEGVWIIKVDKVEICCSTLLSNNIEIGDLHTYMESGKVQVNTLDTKVAIQDLLSKTTFYLLWHMQDNI